MSWRRRRVSVDLPEPCRPESASRGKLPCGKNTYKIRQEQNSCVLYVRSVRQKREKGGEPVFPSPRLRQGQHARGSDEPDRDVLGNAPALAVDLDRPPALVAKIDIDAIIGVPDPHEG